MLVGTTRKQVPSTDIILNHMESSSFRFFLTGSRYFGWERSDSDWDFFAESTAGIVSTLQVFGLREDVTEGYQDSLTGKVFVGHSIHVQMVTSLATKQSINEFFRCNKRLLAVPSYSPHMKLIWTPKPKEVQRAAWQTAAAMCLSHVMASTKANIFC